MARIYRSNVQYVFPLRIGDNVIALRPKDIVVIDEKDVNAGIQELVSRKVLIEMQRIPLGVRSQNLKIFAENFELPKSAGTEPMRTLQVIYSRRKKYEPPAITTSESKERKKKERKKEEK